MKTLSEMFRAVRDALPEPEAPRPVPADKAVAAFQKELFKDQADVEDKKWRDIEKTRKKPEPQEIPPDLFCVTQEALTVGWQSPAYICGETQKWLAMLSDYSEYSVREILLYFLKRARGAAERSGGFDGQFFPIERTKVSDLLMERAAGQGWMFLLSTDREPLDVRRSNGHPFHARFSGVVIFNPLHVEIRKVKGDENE